MVYRWYIVIYLENSILLTGFLNQFIWLMGGWPTPLKHMKVSWDDEIPNIPNIWENNVPNHQPDGRSSGSDLMELG